MMRGTGDIEQFTSDPIGRYLIGGSWVHGCAHESLFGVLLWGRPSADDVATLVQSLACELAPGIAAHQSLVDASRLGSVDADTFELLTAYVRDHHDALSRSVTRLALVRPEGLAGAVASGFFGVLEAPYPVQLFEDARAALAWLDEGAPLAGELDAIYSDAAEAGPLLSSLRLYLADHLDGADVAGAARAMKLSERSLQRRLKDGDTTFQRELLGARVREAQRRMLDTDASLTAIALDCGFASLQHFSGQFRRVTGETPSAWRSRHGR